MSDTTKRQKPQKIRDGGLLAEFEDVTTLAKACEQVRDAGYKKWDAYSPFPIHGIDPRMGIKPTKLPWAIFFAGMTGTSVAMLLQWWTNAVDYQFMLSGKPIWSVPANIPVGFELTVLFSAFTAFFATLGVIGLPRFHNPLFNHERFKRATDDRFFIVVESDDKRYSPEKTKELLEEAGSTFIEHVKDDSHIGAALPGKLKWGIAAATAFTFIPLGVIAKMRTGFSEKPRLHVWRDMDSQPKFKTQTSNSMFADGRAMRLPEAGTIPVGELRVDDHKFRGIVDNQWASTLPDGVEGDKRTIERGKERFGIYCTPCHGEAGYGNGMVHRRALAIGNKAKGWIAPASLHTEEVRAQPVGQLYNTITNGIRNMSGYGHAMPPEDRWAIAAYIKALQLSQGAPVSDLPENAKLQLK